MVVRTTSHQEQPSSCPERGGSCPAHAHATPSSRTGRSTGRDRVVVRAERYMLAARARERGGCGVSHFIEGIKLLIPHTHKIPLGGRAGRPRDPCWVSQPNVAMPTMTAMYKPIGSRTGVRLFRSSTYGDSSLNWRIF